jgi:hypothetical protein
MGSRYTHSILAANQAVSADGVQVFDLPVNPLSVVLLHLSPLAETSTIGNHSLLLLLLSALDNVTVSFRGGSFINLSGRDLAALCLLWHRWQIWQSNAVETDNDRRSIVIPVPFGRKAFDVKECFPASKKGELSMSCTWDIADTGFDGLRISVETIELPGATPDFVQKCTTLSRTLTATGQNEIDLPIGNFLRAVLLFGTTSYTGASPAPSLGQLQLLKDNVQQFISASDFEVLRGVMGLKSVMFPPDYRHIHSGTYTTTVAGDSREPEIGLSLDANYALMDLDPLQDDSFGMDTSGAGRVHVRLDAETADAVRVIPVERVASSVFLEAP